MTTLVDRYRLLLRCYPRAYRAERGEEILDTVAELARPGQRYPSVRESAALVLGGLRTRTGANLRRSPAGSWAGGLHLAVLVLLVDAATAQLSGTVFGIVPLVRRPAALPGSQLHEALRSIGTYPVTAVLVGGMLVAAAAGRRRLVLLLTPLAMLAQHWAPSGRDETNVLWQVPLAAVLTLPLLRWSGPAARHPWRWLLAVPVALVAVTPIVPDLFFSEYAWPVYLVQSRLLFAVLVGCVLAGIVDARISIAAAALPLASAVSTLAAWLTWPPDFWSVPMPDGTPSSVLMAAAVAAVPLASGAWWAARQARR